MNPLDTLCVSESTTAGPGCKSEAGWSIRLASRRVRMRVVCAWCGAVLRKGDGVPDPKCESHGICTPCAEKYFGNGGAR